MKLCAIAKLDECGGNMAKAARDGGVARGCLQQWVKQREEVQSVCAERQVSVRKRWCVAQDADCRFKLCLLNVQLSFVQLYW